MFDPKIVAQDFPILDRTINGKRLVYLDNGATSQKPRVVIAAISKYYETSNANVHRGVHTLSDESTHNWEESRKTIAQFFGAEPDELILTRNTTEALNGVVWGWAEYHLKPGDIVLTTVMEHHANIVPWQEVCIRKQASLKFIAVDENGRLDLRSLESLLTEFGQKIKLIALTHVSNVLGTCIPIQAVVNLVHDTYKGDVRPRIVIDGAQSAPHLAVNFKTLGVDFFAFSGHKMLGPMGVGGLLVRKKLLESQEMRPWYFGGGMIAEVTQSKTVFAEDVSERFTPGTPDVASAVGLAAACDYLKNLGMQEIERHDQELVHYAVEKLSQVPQVQLVGPTALESDSQKLDRVGAVSFVYQGVHAHDVAQVLDSEGIAVRSGHHCTMPLHVAKGWQATVRVSFQVYNSKEDIAVLIQALEKVAKIFNK